MIFSFIKSVILTLIIIPTALAAGFVIYSATILLWAPQKDIPPHDAVIVLTGASGRIEAGFKLLLEDKAPRMLISGVINNATFEDILANNSGTLSTEEKTKIINHCCIDIDYIADTTITNAIETNKWITANDIYSFSRK